MAVDDHHNPEEFRPPPDPSMRTWRHPSELAAAAEQAALIDRRHRLKTGLTVAAGVLIGAGGVMVGLASIRGATTDSLAIIGTSSTIGSLSAAVALSPTTITTIETPAPTSAPPSEPIVESSPTTDVNTALLVSTSMPNGIVAISGSNPNETVISSGISHEGYVLTSASALEGRQRLVIWNGSDSVPGRVVGLDPFSDLAVVGYDGSIEFPQLVILEPAAIPEPGNQIRVVGLNGDGKLIGEDGSILSLRHRTVSNDGQDILGSIRTTALLGQLKPGALLSNDDGQPIGLVVNSADHLISALPLDDAARIANSLIENGWASDTWLGVSCSTSPLGLKVDEVSVNSPASLGGLDEGDIVISLNDVRLNSVTDLVDELRKYDPATMVDLLIERDSERVQVQVQLGAREVMIPGDN